MAFCRDILEPYEKVFPRRKEEKEKGMKEQENNNNKTDSVIPLLALI
jgi:hypothetical protein